MEEVGVGDEVVDDVVERRDESVYRSSPLSSSLSLSNSSSSNSPDSGITSPGPLAFLSGFTAFAGFVICAILD